MSDLSPKQARKRRKDLLGKAGLGATVLIVLAALTYMWKTSPPSLDQGTLCPEDTGPSSYWAVILDGTDRYNAVQQRSIRNEFNSIKEQVPKHGMLAVYSVPTQPARALEPIVKLCNPGSGEDLSIWTSNPELAQRRWREDFDTPLQQTIGSILNDTARQRSYIMETIQAVKVGADAFDVRDRRMFIFSDMMQHTARYSHYRPRVPSFEGFDEMESYRRKVQTNLSEWEAEVFYARRDNALAERVQGRKHIYFWEQYFAAMDGRIVRVKRLDG